MSTETSLTRGARLSVPLGSLLHESENAMSSLHAWAAALSLVEIRIEKLSHCSRIILMYVKRVVAKPQLDPYFEIEKARSSATSNMAYVVDG